MRYLSHPTHHAGKNFGPANAYTNARLRAEYGTVLQNGPFANISFVAADCAVAVPHELIRCKTAEGAGKGLGWVVTVDSVTSAVPTTAYAPPEVLNITDTAGRAVDAASVDGGTELVITGINFGAPLYRSTGLSFVQSVTYGPTGVEYTVPASALRVISHTEIRVVLGPGASRDLAVRVAIADQLSAPSTILFSDRKSVV